MRSQSRPSLNRSPRRRRPENVCILSSLFIYADNWNFAKVYCAFSIICASEKLAKPFSTQFKLSKELWILEIRSIFAVTIFSSCEPLGCVDVNRARGNLISQTIGISRKFTALFLLSVHRKYQLNLLVHNLSFLRNFEFWKSIQYFVRNSFFTL